MCHYCVSSGKTERESRLHDALEPAEIEKVRFSVAVKVKRFATGKTLRVRSPDFCLLRTMGFVGPLMIPSCDEQGDSVFLDPGWVGE